MFVVEKEGCHDCAHDTMGLFTLLEKATDFVEDSISEFKKSFFGLPDGIWFISEWEVDQPLRGHKGLRYRVEVTGEWDDDTEDYKNVTVHYFAPRGTKVRSVPLASKK